MYNKILKLYLSKNRTKTSICAWYFKTKTNSRYLPCLDCSPRRGFIPSISFSTLPKYQIFYVPLDDLKEKSFKNRYFTEYWK